MAFAKRAFRVSARVEPAAAAAPLSLTAALPATERYLALRDVMMRILGVTINIADAMRSNGSVPMPGFGGVFNAEATPINIRGIAEHFVVVENGTTLHAMFTYVAPDHLDQISPAAQFHLHDLISRVRDLNLFCQHAERDEALGVALQSPTLPPKVDRILVMSAFFAAYFENLVTVGHLPIGLPGKAPAGIDFEVLKASLARHKLMATDKMLEPEQYDAHVPDVAWPHLPAELVRKPESGQQILLGVYFPALYARQIATKAKLAGDAVASAKAALTD